MDEFKSLGHDFVRRTRRRILAELSVLVFLTICFWRGPLNGIPSWIKFSALGAVAAYILVGIALYPSAKSTARTFSIRLLDDSLAFSHQGTMRKIPYGDISISRLRRHSDKLIQIDLKTTFGQTIRLRDLENMDKLYAKLTQFVKQH